MGWSGVSNGGVVARCIAFSPDSKLVAGATSWGLVKVWQTSGKLHLTLDGHEDGVGWFGFLPPPQEKAQAHNAPFLVSVDGKGKL